MERKIKQVHFQITRNCNLRCSFCGQWGKKGFFSDAKGIEMSFEDWENVVSQLEKCRQKTGENICVTIWGGEPLVSPFFDDLLILVKQKGFITEVITNGFFIDKHKAVLENYADRLYVSLDGPEQIHDEIRGMGVFKKVVKNLRELNHKKVIIMAVISEKMINVLPDFLKELDALNISSLYLQDMIGFTSEEIRNYKNWMKNTFGIDSVDIASWENNHNLSYSDILEKVLKSEKKHDYCIEHKIHTNSTDSFCSSPFRHIHITWNGAVTYCTDFYDFKAGNVKESPVDEIFFNEISEKYREEISRGKCVLCNHCSWKNKKMEEY